MRKIILPLVFTLSLLMAAVPSMAEQFNVLMFTKTVGWHHKAVNEAITAMRKMAKRHYFTMDWEEDASIFTDAKLKQFDAVMFLLTTGDILNDQQQAAMERFIQSGKGFVGVHSAADTEYHWPWYTKMVGRSFHIHPVIQSAYISVQDTKFPGLARMPKTFLWTDEFYQYGPELADNLHYLLTVDEKTYNPVADWGRVKGKGMGKFHPLAWYHNYAGGRAFYTGLGHMPGDYSDRLFLEHLYGGLYWAATGKGIRP